MRLWKHKNYTIKAMNRSWLLLCSACSLFIQTATAQAPSWEVNMVRSINPMHPSGTVWDVISTTAKPISVIVPTGIMIAALIHKDKSAQQKAIEIGGSIFIAAATTSLMKQVIRRERPANVYTGIYPDQPDNGYSFPSGHVSVSFASAASLSIQYKKWYITLPAYLWSTSVAYSRIYMGQHYPTDVVMGAATGIGSAYLSHWLNKKIFLKKQTSKTK